MTHTADPHVVRRSVLGVEMDDDEPRILAQVMRVRTLEDGEVLVREGDIDVHLHLLAKGRIQAQNCVDQAQCVLYEMRIGDVAGTRAFVDGTPRRATMRAVGGDAVIYALAPADFDKLVDTHPRLAYKAMRALFRMTYINLTRIDSESEQLRNYMFKARGRY